MKSNKTLAALVTMGLAASVATPAMALENQFSGAFTSFYDISNFSAVGNDGFSSNLQGLAKDAKTANYFVQRVKLNYTAKASDEVKLVTKFELDYNYLGNNSYDNVRGGGGALGADGINLETKNLYLDLNLTKSLNSKLGMMGNTDAFKGLIFDADMAGILLANNCTNNFNSSIGFFRFNDDNSAGSALGKRTYDMVTLDGKYSVTKDIKVGGAYYYISDDRAGADTKVHTLGLNAEGAVGPVTLTGFVLAQFGDRSATDDAKGYAFDLGARIPLGGGTLRADLLYVPGDDNQLYVVPGEGGAFYDNEMIMLSRDKNTTSIDNALVFDVNNYGQGVIFGSAGYDYEFSPKLSGSANLGFAMVAENKGPNKNDDHLGTELNCEANYKFTPDVTFGARAGYVVLGDYFKDSVGGDTPDNPYDIKLLAKFSF